MLAMSLNLELTNFLSELLNRQDINGMVFVSGKPGCFIAGADISEIEAISCPEDGVQLSKLGQIAFNKISELPWPTVAAISGYCLGGGLELAMAFDFRVADTSPKTLLGLPETTIGVIPGFGGTQRLPILVGVDQALQMILSGKHLTADQAQACGLIDKIVEEKDLVSAAVKMIHLANKNRPHQDKSSKKLNKNQIEVQAASNELTDIFNQARQDLKNRCCNNSSALFAAIDAVEYGAAYSLEAGLNHEAELFGKISATQTAKKMLKAFRSRKQK